MKIPFTLLLLSILLVASSCNKNPISKEDPDDCPPPFPLVTKITGTTSLGGDGSIKAVNVIFTYDTSVRLVNITDGQKKLDILYDNRIAHQFQYADSTNADATRKLDTAISIMDVTSLYAILHKRFSQC